MSADIHPDLEPQSAISFFAKYRWPILGGAAVVLVSIFLLIGIAIGMAKKNFEKKFYLTQIEKLKEALSKSLEKRTELDHDISELKIELRAKKDHLAELEDKVEKLERAQKHAGSSEGAVSTTATKTAESAAPEGDGSEAYLRLKAGDCLVEGSSGATAANWRECLKKGKKTPGDAKAAH